MKKLGIIHCDMKPENLLLIQANRSGIKIIDLGSACYQDERIYTYIQSRFYRAPEIILGIPYTVAIDMWSFGCIIAELYKGYPLFPGESESEQIQAIAEVLDLPPEHLLNDSPRSKLFFHSNNDIKVTANSRGRVRHPGTRALHDTLHCKDVNFLDFISRCLDWDPKTRMTPEEAFNHEWI